MSVSNQMKALLEESEEMDLSAIIPQLVLGMEAMGLDPSEEDGQKKFVQILKLLSGSKKAALISGMKKFTSSKAKGALKAAKASV